MSLKHFHILFISVAVCLMLLMGMWAVNNSAPGAAVGSFLLAVGLVVYEYFFIKKIKNQHL